MEPALHERGLCAYRQGPRQLVLSRQRGPVWPDAGNSFWVCRLGGDWYICTWAPHHYRVPQPTSVLDVAEAFVDIDQSAQRHIPAELVMRFGLIETDNDEFDRLWQANA